MNDTRDEEITKTLTETGDEYTNNLTKLFESDLRTVSGLILDQRHRMAEMAHYNHVLCATEIQRREICDEYPKLMEAYSADVAALLQNFAEDFVGGKPNLPELKEALTKTRDRLARDMEELQTRLQYVKDECERVLNERKEDSAAAQRAIDGAGGLQGDLPGENGISTPEPGANGPTPTSKPAPRRPVSKPAKSPVAPMPAPVTANVEGGPWLPWSGLETPPAVPHVDIAFRNGQTRENIEPGSYIWFNDPKEIDEHDIMFWRPHTP